MLDRQVRAQLSCHGVDRCAPAALHWAPLARSRRERHTVKVSSRSDDRVSNLRLLLRSLIAPREPGPLAATPPTSPALPAAKEDNVAPVLTRTGTPYCRSACAEPDPKVGRR